MSQRRWAHLPYKEVQGYADLYTLQKSFQDPQDEVLREFGQIVTPLQFRSARQPTVAELQAWEDRLVHAEAVNWTQRIIAKESKEIFEFTLTGAGAR